MESPFTDRLNTCNHATDAEVPKIREVIADLLEERKRIENRIELFGILMNDLFPRWNAINEHIEDHRTLICTINRLPVELVRTIFCWCLPSRDSAMSSKDFPLLLGRVCSAWRQISFSTPQLWTSLYIQVPRMDISKPEKQDLLTRYGRAVIAWLKRSASLPISLSFIDDGQSPFHPNSLALTETPGFYLLEILLGFSDRWNHVNFAVDYRSMAYLARLNEHDVPFLHTAQIEIKGLHREADLSSLSFLRSPSSSLRWEALTTLVMTYRTGPSNTTALSVDEALTTLTKCLSLVTCVLDIQAHPNNSFLPSDRTPIRLPHLQDLVIKLSSSVPSEHIKSLFQMLDLPDLRLLELEGGQEYRQLPFMPLLLRPHKIDTLALDVQASTVQDLMECLHMTPFLKRLYLNSVFFEDLVYLDDIWGGMPSVLDQDMVEESHSEVLPGVSTTFLTRLMPDSSVAEINVCPLLEEIEIRFPESSKVTDDHILQFILSRTTLAPQTITRLARAHLSFHRDMQQDIYNDLAPAIRMGLDLQLKYDPDAPHVLDPTFSPFRHTRFTTFSPEDCSRPRFAAISW
ncbi:hypothetical protein FPV67DRAFT_1667654 [Lyophyllum atratum]|nr:hypothetical protein FPV67DRAFT_1667654 [Lyophyllum atratum]